MRPRTGSSPAFVAEGFALDVKPKDHLRHRVAQRSSGCTTTHSIALRDQDEGERVGQDQRDVEQLEIDLNLEADAVAAAEQLDHQDDLPDQRETGASGGEEIRRELRQDHVPQRPPA